MTEGNENVISMKAVSDHRQRAFIGWQCRIRQLAVRDGDARPTSGMRPHLKVAGQDVGPITVVIVPVAPEVSTSEFRHIVRRTHDPRERYQAALRYLQSSYFQDPASFDDGLTAVFGVEAALPQRLSGRRDCELTFEQFSQRYQLPCRAERLTPEDPAFQATYWHNALFNPAMPALVEVLRFKPDWTKAKGEPQSC